MHDLGVTNIAIAQQIHGIRVATAHAPGIFSGADGLVSKRVPLGVTYADCVPILAVDPAEKIIGTAHAGWKGTLAGIAQELIFFMEKIGADKKNIYVSIGPHIGMCCYNILEDRANVFLKKYTDEKIVSKIDGEWHLDIGFANYQTLLDAGIQKDHIDAPPTCTSCQVALFNSFRKDSKESFGVQLGVIAL